MSTGGKLATPSTANLYTRVARDAKDIAEFVNATFDTLRLRPHGYRAELTKPDELSTGGGVRARQNIRLIPAVEGKRTLLVGHANRSEKKAELKSYDLVDANHRRQFGTPVELEREDYEQLLQMALNVLGILRLNITIVGQEGLSLQPPPIAPRGGGGRGQLVAFFLGIVVAALAAATYLWWRAR